MSARQWARSVGRGRATDANGRPLLPSHSRIGPLEPDAFSESPLLLKIGWNQLIIKVVQNAGNWQFAGKLSCSDPGFLQKLEFASEKPTQ